MCCSQSTILSITPDRLVESARVKKALEAIYVNILPKGAFPFIYLRYVVCRATLCRLTPVSLVLDPHSVDVNVHPTKKEVHFLDEEKITQRIADVMLDVLVGENQSKSFEYQVCLCFSPLRMPKLIIFPRLF